MIFYIRVKERWKLMNHCTVIFIDTSISSLSKYNLRFPSFARCEINATSRATHFHLNVSCPPPPSPLLPAIQTTRLPRNCRKLNFIEQNGDYPAMNRESFRACLRVFTRVVSICLQPSSELKLKRHIQPATPMIRPFA